VCRPHQGKGCPSGITAIRFSGCAVRRFDVSVPNCEVHVHARDYSIQRPTPVSEAEQTELFNSDVISLFVVMLKDESQLVKQQSKAETLKKQSETLLYQILPYGIAT
jgi:hypothetical protein